MKIVTRKFEIQTHPEFNLRRSQLISPFGTGALVDINNETIMLADSEYWDYSNSNKIHDVRLEQAMNAVGFIEPPVSDQGTIKGKIFPQWYYSPQSREMLPISEWRKMIPRQRRRNDTDKFNRRPYDPRSPHVELIPARIICVCGNGHVQDFPWLDWPHKGMERQEYAKHHVSLKSSGSSSKFSDYYVICNDCGRREKLNVFNKDIFQKQLKDRGIQCHGKLVWKQGDQASKCNAPLQVAMKSATNLYFPNVISSVNIPFEQDQTLELLQKKSSADYEALLQQIFKFDEADRVNKIKKDSTIDTRIKLNADNLEGIVNQEEIKQALISKFSVDKVNTTMGYRREEFEVLSGRKGYTNKNKRFQIQVIDKDNFNLEKTSYFTDLIDKITLIHQLEVIRVLRGYSRINPTDNEQIKEMVLEGNESPESAKEVSLRRSDGRYVGMSSLGEGFFIELSAKKIQRWLSDFSESNTFSIIKDKESKVAFDDDLQFVDPAYYLLHTLSHLIIRELNFNSGYSSASLKERLYFSNSAEQENMYGILIYTSSSDAEGTLGGLVKQGVPATFFKILENAISKARWCSFDPICISSPGQGRNSLNGAACHACALISETSCEKMNLFLDRRVLVGEYGHPEVGFFYNN